MSRYEDFEVLKYKPSMNEVKVSAAMPLTDGRMWFTERQVTIPANGVEKAMIRTGDTPVLIKQREFRFKGLRVSFVIYKAPTVSALGPEFTTTYNVAPGGAAAGRKFKLYPTPTITNDGAQYTPVGLFQGDAASFTRQSCFPVILEPNTDYILITTNLDNAGPVEVRTRAVLIESNDDFSALLLDNRVEL